MKLYVMYINFVIDRHKTGLHAFVARSTETVLTAV